MNLLTDASEGLHGAVLGQALEQVTADTGIELVDASFYRHQGVDPKQSGDAFLHTIVRVRNATHQTLGYYIAMAMQGLQNFLNLIP